MKLSLQQLEAHLWGVANILRGKTAGQDYDAVISLPLNVFYGAGVPACLLILRKQRPVEHRDQVLLVYAARHYRELSAQNQLRPQDVMRMLVHYHAYGDAAKVPSLIAKQSERIREQIDLREEDEVGRLEAEYQSHTDKLAALDAEIGDARLRERAARMKGDKASAAATAAKAEKQRDKVAAKVAERDERIAEARRHAEDDRKDVASVGDELTTLYADPDELLKHARVIDHTEILENEFNLNIPRYVDTFEPEPGLRSGASICSHHPAIMIPRPGVVPVSVIWRNRRVCSEGR